MKFLQNALGPWGLLAAIGIYALLVCMSAGALFPRSQGLATIVILALTLGGAWLLLGGGPPLQLLGFR